MTTDKRKISDESLERLRQTVIELFSEGLFHHVGLREIAKRAGVGLQTIYKYFGNKDELIIAAISKDMETLTVNMAKAQQDFATRSSKEKFESFGFEYFDFYLGNPHIAQIVFMNVPHRYWVTHPKFVQNEQLLMIENLIRDGQQTGEIRTDCDPALLVQMLVGALTRLMVIILNSEDMAKSSREANLLSGTILWPMLAKPKD